MKYLVHPVILIMSVIFISSCGPGGEEYEQLKTRAEQMESENQRLNSEIEKLRSEVNELKFGAERLLSQARIAIDAGHDLDARSTLQELIKRHPTSNETPEAKKLLANTETRISAAEEKRKRDEEKRKEEASQALERATRNLEKKVDEIEGITWMSHQGTPVLGKYASLYFGTRNGKASGFPVRLRVQYYDDSWLFVRSLTIKADDKTFEMPGIDFKRDNSSGSIWEWMDVPITDHQMLQSVMNAKKVVIRFHGDTYYSDFTVPSEQKNMMKDVYAAWQSLGGTPD